MLTDLDLVNYAICPMLFYQKKDVTILSPDQKSLLSAIMRMHKYELYKKELETFFRAKIDLKGLFYAQPEHQGDSIEDRAIERQLTNILYNYHKSVYQGLGNFITLDMNFDYTSEVYDRTIRGCIPILLTNKLSVIPLFFSGMVSEKSDLLRFIPVRLAALSFRAAGVIVKEFINFNLSTGKLVRLENTPEFASKSIELLESIVKAINLGVKYHGCPPNQCRTGICS